MFAQKQLFRHIPSEGIIGDCFRTCIASVLGLTQILVPHGYQEFWVDEKTNVSEKVQAQLNKWLEQSGYNLKFIEYPVETTYEQLRTYLRHYYTDMYVVVGCSSKNGGHSVVMKNDDYLWDPSIDDSGCIGPMSDGYYWIGLLVYKSS